jgi:V8-like Glu-specific endopeptidase
MTPSIPLLAVSLALLGPSGPGKLSDVIEHTAAVAPVRYWTAERMAAALPIDLLPVLTQVTGGAPPAQHQRAGAAGTSGARWSAGGAVARTTGRVFLTMDGVDFVCSAGSVRGANKDLVVTAGHCVKDGTGSWAENWMFVPGYNAGREPYGSFPARRMFVAGPWSRSSDDSYDVGMVAVATRGGKHLADVVGAQEIGFNAPRGRHTYGFGFPADPPYNGEHLMFCAGDTKPDPNEQTYDQGLRCDLTAGASGGPWLSGFDQATGRGTVTSVSSFKYSNDRGTMYGPYFGSAAKTLYQTAERA